VRALLVILWFVLAGLAVACEDDYREIVEPLIEDVRPASARPGQQVTLVGRNFGLLGAADRVHLGGAEVQVESWGDRALLIRLPDPYRAGVFDLVVQSGGMLSAPFPFEVKGPLETDAEALPDANVGNIAP
jgi:hypothetical protein